MTRVSENQLAGSLLNHISTNRQELNKYSNEVSTGYKAVDPGDSLFAGTIVQMRQQLDALDGYKTRITLAESRLGIQDAVIQQGMGAVVRAKEIATQAANETLSVEQRAQLVAEVWQLRDQLVDMGNTTYQGRYIFAGSADDVAPFQVSGTPYTNPASGEAHDRYVYSSAAGAGNSRTINVTNDLSMTISTPGSQIFNNAIYAIERLGRALEGYDTLPASGAPDGTGAAYVFPTDYGLQTDAIRGALDLLETARSTDMMGEVVDLAGRLGRLDSAKKVLDDSKISAQEVLSRLQDADVTESATKLQQAQTALEASLTVTARILRLSILDYI